MALAKLCQTIRQVSIALDTLIEYLHMTGAIHRFDRITASVLHFARVHMLAEDFPVTGRFPERAFHDFGRVDFLVTGFVLTPAHIVDEVLEQAPAFGMPEYGAGCFFLEMKQVH